ncbi:uncharacterized protein [Halyomorpha halys]|uniref:uncharacterized protein isoform X2 n=1 Tax=Halyomorpha halys TaxID=286706 RepID=UPI0034D1936A
MFIYIRSEWVAVFNGLYSRKYDEVVKALDTIIDWSDSMEWRYRPGMDCTRGIMQVAISDRHLYPDTKSPADLHQLQLMYSAEIMRFLNLLNDEAGKKNRKMSMYARAKIFNIPDWVVNIRHQMAHGNVLPSIDALRMTADIILEWLKTNYWEVEERNMEEYIVENTKVVVEESLPALLTIYVSLKEQNILGFNYIRDIQDPDVKDQIYLINRVNMYGVISRCQPSDLKEGGNTIVDLEKLKDYSISRMVFLLLKLLKEFIYPEYVYGVNTINILVEKLIDDSAKHNGMRCLVWGTFLKAMHSWLKLPVLIKAMADKSYENTGERAYQAGIWNVELCKALQKRYKVEYLKNTMITETISGKLSKNKKKAKFSNLDSNERKEFMKLLLKKNLNLIGQSDNKILACIFHRVEQKNSKLRNVLRLQDPIFPPHWELVNLIKYIALRPTEFTENCLLALADVMKYPMNTKALIQIIKLGKIFKGEGVSIHKVYRIFKSINLGETSNRVEKENQQREKFRECIKDMNSRVKMKEEAAEDNSDPKVDEPIVEKTTYPVTRELKIWVCKKNEFNVFELEQKK